MTTPITTAIVSKDERIEIFLRKPETIARFTPLLGKSAQSFVNSALILINSDPKLQECTTMSLYKATLRAATLELSLDLSVRQGWIIPRSRKIKGYKNQAGEMIPEHWVKEASFQPHYNGLRNLAERTGKYKVINCSPIYKGQHIRLDQLTGLHYIVYGDTFTIPEQANRLTVANTLDVTDGRPAEDQVIGYLAYYKKFDGTEKTAYMSIREIHEYAQKWAPDNYNNEYGTWKNPKTRPTMEMKTVFLALTKLMDLTGKESAKLKKAIEIEDGDDFSDLETVEGQTSEPDPEPEQPKNTPEVITAEAVTIQAPTTGFTKPEPTAENPDPVSDVTWKMYEETKSKANAARLTIPYVNREKTTDADLIAHIKELEFQIKKAKK